MLCERISLTIVCNFELRRYDFRGRYSAIPINRGDKRKLRSGQPGKVGAVVWQWVATLKGTVPPPPGVWLEVQVEGLEG